MAGWFYFDRKGFLRAKKKMSDTALKFIARDLLALGKKKLKPQKPNKPHSLPGEPPLIDTAQSVLKRLMAYSVDYRSGKIVVGPLPFRDSKNKASSPVPNILEHGGRAIAHVTEYRNIVHRQYRRPKWAQDPVKRKRCYGSMKYREWKQDHSYTVNRPVSVKPRPWMKPTLDEYTRSGGFEKALKRAVEWSKTHK